MILFVLGYILGAVFGAVVYSLIMRIQRPWEKDPFYKKEWDGPFYEMDEWDYNEIDKHTENK